MPAIVPDQWTGWVVGMGMEEYGYYGRDKAIHNIVVVVVRQSLCLYLYRERGREDAQVYGLLYSVR